MRIGLIDVDGHNYPNIPLMKISAWHKAQGHDVEWYDPMFSGHMDKVYVSKVFSFSPDFEYFIDADEKAKTLNSPRKSNTFALIIRYMGLRTLPMAFCPEVAHGAAISAMWKQKRAERPARLPI